MARYEMECNECGHIFERWCKFEDMMVAPCNNCNSHDLRQRFSPPTIRYKSPGFHTVDYPSLSKYTGKKDNNTGADNVKI